MSSSSTPLYVDVENKLLICLIHGYCIMPSKVHEHFSHDHRDAVSAAQCQDLRRYVSNIKGLHQSWKDATKHLIEHPPHPIKWLRPPENALRCKQCGEVRAGQYAEVRTKKHFRSQHNVLISRIQNEIARGDLRTSVSWADFIEEVMAQRLCNKGYGSKLFKVLPDTISFPQQQASNPPLECSGPVGEDGQKDLVENSEIDMEDVGAVQELFGDESAQGRQERTHIPEVTEELARIPEDFRVKGTAYVTRTCFHRCVAGMEWAQAREYTQPSVPSQHLKLLEATVNSMVLVWQNTVAWKSSRWARVQVMVELNHQDQPSVPLAHYEDVSLRQHHTNILVDIFTFFYQVLEHGMNKPATLNLSTRQKEAWNRIHDHLLNPACDLAVDHNYRRLRLNVLESLCHRFWIALLEQQSIFGDLDLALVTALGFLAVDPKKESFRPRKHFVANIAAIKKLARFAACQELHDSYEPAVVEEARVDEMMLAEEVPDVLHSQQTLYAGNPEFMFWVSEVLTDKLHTPMAWLIEISKYVF